MLPDRQNYSEVRESPRSCHWTIGGALCGEGSADDEYGELYQNDAVSDMALDDDGNQEIKRTTFDLTRSVYHVGFVNYVRPYGSDRLAGCCSPFCSLCAILLLCNIQFRLAWLIQVRCNLTILDARYEFESSRERMMMGPVRTRFDIAESERICGRFEKHTHYDTGSISYTSVPNNWRDMFDYPSAMDYPCMLWRIRGGMSKLQESFCRYEELKRHHRFVDIIISMRDGCWTFFVIAVTSWTAFILSHLKEIWDFLLFVLSLPTGATGWTSNETGINIEQLPCGSKYFAVFIGCLQFLVAILLLLVGISVLTIDISLLSLILDALSLSFVLNLDSLLVQGISKMLTGSFTEVVTVQRSIQHHSMYGKRVRSGCIVLLMLSFTIVMVVFSVQVAQQNYLLQFQQISYICLWAGPTPDPSITFPYFFPVPGLCETLTASHFFVHGPKWPQLINDCAVPLPSSMSMTLKPMIDMCCSMLQVGVIKDQYTVVTVSGNISAVKSGLKERIADGQFPTSSDEAERFWCPIRSWNNTILKPYTMIGFSYLAEIVPVQAVQQNCQKPLVGQICGRSEMSSSPWACDRNFRAALNRSTKSTNSTGYKDFWGFVPR